MIEIPVNVDPTVEQKFISYCIKYNITVIIREVDGWGDKRLFYMDTPNFMRWVSLTSVKYRDWHYRQSFLDEVALMDYKGD